MKVKFFFVKNIYEYAFLANQIGIPGDVNAQAMEIARTKSKAAAEFFLYEWLIKHEIDTGFKNHKEIYESELHEKTEIDGLNFDFNFGLRLDVPSGNFHVKISDFYSETVFFDENISDVRLMSSDYYYIKWHIEISRDGEKIFEHVFNPAGKNILINFFSSALGDNIAMIPYAEEFQRVHNCKVKILLPEFLRDFAANLYPEIEQVKNLSYDYYATYYLSFNFGPLLMAPQDARTIPLNKIGGVGLGLKTIPQLRNFTPTKKRKIKKPFVCIGVQASTTFKGWHYPGGWNIVIDYLKKIGYQVLCIDAEKTMTQKLKGGTGIYTVTKPQGAENYTGLFPLMDRANMLYYADFFIGLGSGLAWLANAVGCPVVLISGFSKDWAEFYTPYRVSNRFVCNGCYNDVRLPDFNKIICPKYRETPRELECQKKISPHQVIQAINQLIADKNLLERNGWNERK